jgi:hypothetical protein
LTAVGKDIAGCSCILTAGWESVSKDLQDVGVVHRVAVCLWAAMFHTFSMLLRLRSLRTSRRK